MTTRTTKTTVTFEYPFYFDIPDKLLPAGDYDIETDEELIQGISFTAYRKVQSYLRLKPSKGYPGTARTLVIGAGLLEAALERDNRSVLQAQSKSKSQ